VVEVWRAFRQGTIVAEQVGKLLRHIGRVSLIVINSEGLINFALVGKQQAVVSIIF
jgi:hypothetical protein